MSNETFMEQARRIICADPSHPLAGLLNPETGRWWGRTAHGPTMEYHPVIQAGHLTSKFAGGDRLALQDAFTNWLESALERGGQVHIREAVNIGGVPVERASALMLQQLGVIPRGTVENAATVEGWREGHQLSAPEQPVPTDAGAMDSTSMPGGADGQEMLTGGGMTSAAADALAALPFGLGGLSGLSGLGDLLGSLLGFSGNGTPDHRSSDTHGRTNDNELGQGYDPGGHQGSGNAGGQSEGRMTPDSDSGGDTKGSERVSPSTTESTHFGRSVNEPYERGSDPSASGDSSGGIHGVSGAGDAEGVGARGGDDPGLSSGGEFPVDPGASFAGDHPSFGESSGRDTGNDETPSNGAENDASEAANDGAAHADSNGHGEHGGSGGGPDAGNADAGGPVSGPGGDSSGGLPGMSGGGPDGPAGSDGNELTGGDASSAGGIPNEGTGQGGGANDSGAPLDSGDASCSGPDPRDCDPSSLGGDNGDFGQGS